MRARHDSIIRYVIAYVILASFTLLAFLIRPIGTYLITALIIPTVTLVTMILVSDFVRYRSNATADILRGGLLAPSLFTYLLIGGLTSILIANYRGILSHYKLPVEFLSPGHNWRNNQ
ncbi:hypothetical protein [Vulcanisaeta distributa]|uniref:hypothetical protein n=1 Tax=Vulcanisaeta distributa TaxID=164451 RepID=UPI001FB3061C|nr:hypothetical protein [Vulcanisaeta distributa]